MKNNILGGIMGLLVDDALGGPSDMHVGSLIGCSIYVQLALALIKGCNKEQAYLQVIELCTDYYGN